MNANRSVSYLIIEMTVEERDFARMSEDLGTTIWRLRETVRVAKLAATHCLGQMHSLLMHEKHKVWKREFGFDRIETAAEMDEKRSRTSTSPFPNPFLYRNMVIPEHPYTPEALNLQMKVDVEDLRMEIILLQSPSLECDPLPRRATVDTGSEEPGTPPQSPAIGTRSGPKAPQAETQIMEENNSPFETSVDVFLHSNCTSLEQEYILIQSREDYILLQVQPEVGVDDSNNGTTSQAAAREESARLPIGQQQGMTAWSKLTKTGSSIGEGLCDAKFLFLKRNVLPVYCLCLFLYFCLPCLSYFFRFAAEAGTKGDISFLDAPDA